MTKRNPIQLMGITHIAERSVDSGRRRYMDRDFLCLDLPTGTAPSAMESAEEDQGNCRYELQGGRWLFQGSRLPDTITIWRLSDDPSVIEADDETTVVSPRKIPFTTDEAVELEFHGVVYWDAGTTNEVFLDQSGWFHYDPPECLRFLLGHPPLRGIEDVDDLFTLQDDVQPDAESDLTCDDDDVGRMIWLSLCEESISTKQGQIIEKCGSSCIGDHMMEAMCDYVQLHPERYFDEFYQSYDRTDYDTDEYWSPASSWSSDHSDEFEHLEDPHWRSE